MRTSSILPTTQCWKVSEVIHLHSDALSHLKRASELKRHTNESRHKSDSATDEWQKCTEGDGQVKFTVKMRETGRYTDRQAENCIENFKMRPAKHVHHQEGCCSYGSCYFNYYQRQLHDLSEARQQTMHGQKFDCSLVSCLPGHL